LLAGAALLVAGGIGHVLAGLFRVHPASRNTFVFVVGVPNWVFLPLPIAESLYGAEGVRVVLLFNVGAQIMLWTAAVRLLAGHPPGGTTWRGVFMNPGILATVAGAGVVLLWPEAATLGSMQAGFGPRLFAEVLDGGLKMLGSLTIPLSLLVTGAQLGELARADRSGVRAVTGVIAGRLIVAPAVTLVLIRMVAWGLNLPLTPAEFITLAVIVTMPVAISCTMFVERFGGDPGLSATAIFYTTLLSLATVPLAVLICGVWT
jgi:predicted permease